MQPQSIIYLLEDPRDGLIRYIGATRTPLISRLAHHVHTAVYHHKSSMPVTDWICDLIAVEHMPRIRVIDRVPRTLEGAAEEYWISWYADNDAPLLNARTRLANAEQYLQWLDQRCQEDPDWLDHIGHRL